MPPGKSWPPAWSTRTGTCGTRCCAGCRTAGRPRTAPTGRYFATCVGLGRHFLPGDTYAGTRLAARGGDRRGHHDGARLVAQHQGPGLGRGRAAGARRVGPAGSFLLRLPDGSPERPADGPRRPGGDRRRRGRRTPRATAFTSAWPGGEPAGPTRRCGSRPRLYRAEIAAARELGLPVSVHACGPAAAAGQVRTYADEGLLGPDLQLVHLNNASPAEIALAAQAGTPVSVSPWTELQIGYGQPVTGALLAAGLPVGLSVDTTMLSGNADMFAVMKVTQACANGQARHEFALTARDVLRLATIDGARTLGLGAGHRLPHGGQARGRDRGLRRLPEPRRAHRPGPSPRHRRHSARRRPGRRRRSDPQARRRAHRRRRRGGDPRGPRVPRRRLVPGHLRPNGPRYRPCTK